MNGIQEVTGSSPVCSTYKQPHYPLRMCGCFIYGYGHASLGKTGFALLSQAMSFIIRLTVDRLSPVWRTISAIFTSLLYRSSTVVAFCVRLDGRPPFRPLALAARKLYPNPHSPTSSSILHYTLSTPIFQNARLELISYIQTATIHIRIHGTRLTAL